MKKNKIDKIIQKNSLRVPNDVLPTWVFEAKVNGFALESHLELGRRKTNLKVLDEYSKKNINSGKVTPIFEFNQIPFDENLEPLLQNLADSKLKCSYVDPFLLNSLTRGNFLEIDSSSIRVNEWNGNQYLDIRGTGYSASPELLNRIQSESLGMFIFNGQFHALPFSHIQYLVNIDMAISENREKDSNLNSFIRLITLQEAKENQIKESASIDLILGQDNWNVSVTTKSKIKVHHVTIKDGVSINGKAIASEKALCSTRTKLTKTGQHFIDGIEFRHHISCEKCREILNLPPL